MNINEDVKVLLAEVTDNIGKISALYSEALADEQKYNVSKPLVKSSLEHLRSLLDYAAQDVGHHIGVKGRIHFPYGLEEPLFASQVKKNLRGLKDKFPKGYACIESIQPFKTGDDWLKRLCAQVNIDKHNRLSGQLRVNSPAYKTILGQIATLDVNCSITFQDCDVDGIKIGADKPVTIAWNTPLDEINRLLGAVSVSGARRYEWVEFRFTDTAEDLLSLIKKSHSELSTFIPKLYALM